MLPSSNAFAAENDVALSRQLGRALWSGVRLAFFFPPSQRPCFSKSMSVLGVLMLLSIVIPVAFDYVGVHGEGEFFPFGVPGVLFYVPLIFVALAFLALFCKRSVEEWIDLALVVVALNLPILFIEELIHSLQSDTTLFWFQFAQWAPCWFGFAAGVAAIRLLRLSVWQAVLAITGMFVFVVLPLMTIAFRTPLWSGGLDRAYRERYAVASEATIYQQPQLLDDAFNALKPEQPGMIDLYFVGIAGDASQDVFAHEVDAVERLFAERFGTAGRSVHLLNNPNTILVDPLASVTALEWTLQSVGEKMNLDEDVLFLFLTSHGSPEDGLALDFWPLQLRSLTPDLLKQALDDAGIKWRVIVVSACYSGVFVQPLQDDHTIVVTASAPDRQSMGCTHEADWTYFGKAFFDSALQTTPVLTDAFKQATQIIEAREKAEHIDEPSNPQIAAGSAMQAKWSAYLDQLKRAAAH